MSRAKINTYCKTGSSSVFNILLGRKYLAFDFLNIHAGYTYSPNAHLS